MSWPTLHTFADTDTLPASQLNGLRVAIETLETEIDPTGAIQRDLMLFSSTTVAGNSTSVETSVNSYAMPAGKMATNGDCLLIEGAFVCAGNGNTKTVKLYLGTTPITVSSSAASGTVLIVRATIIRASATSEKVWGSTSASGLGALTFANDSFTENLANALAVKFTLTGTATNDLQQSWVRITHSRHP